jgi:predicted transcriptional regulator
MSPQDAALIRWAATHPTVRPKLYAFAMDIGMTTAQAANRVKRLRKKGAAKNGQEARGVYSPAQKAKIAEWDAADRSERISLAELADSLGRTPAAISVYLKRSRGASPRKRREPPPPIVLTAEEQAEEEARQQALREAEARDRLRERVKLTIGQILLGDPMPGMSALDKKREEGRA